MRIEGDRAVDVAASSAKRKWIELEHAAAQLEARIHPIERQRFVADPPSGEVDISVCCVEFLKLKFVPRQNLPGRRAGIVLCADEAAQVAHIEAIGCEVAAHEGTLRA